MVAKQLRIGYCHCCGLGLIPGQRIFACYEEKKKKKKTAGNLLKIIDLISYDARIWT